MMGPPTDNSDEEASTSPPQPSSEPLTTENPDSSSNKLDTVAKNSSPVVVPYTKPDWSGPPCHQFSFEVLKNGAIIQQIDVSKKGAYMFGRVEMCDFVLEHPTVSRFHAVLQFKSNGDAFIYDLGSTHGTFVNKKEVNKRVYVDLRVGDVVRFGQSSRLYLFQGPSDLMPVAKEITSTNGTEQDQLAESLNDLFTSVSTMIKGELQGTNNVLELLEKMNIKVAEEYNGFGDMAAGLRVFVEQLKTKTSSFDEYVHQIDAIEQQVTEFEAVISMLDKHVYLLESKLQSNQIPPS